jgi:small subunit ribosomal protein S1
VSEEYREAFGEHAYDDEGNYVGPVFAETEFTPETEAQAAWADYVAEHGTGEGAPADVAAGEPVADAPAAEAVAAEAPVAAPVEPAVADPAPAGAPAEG